ncbi:hypothetical protein A3K64_03130 [Candidatus Micrarchaeota archaeon RBG_16_36_9]|nr:MAG: hypothetical protein A3K64_03130 [Candidatus Micrarchaeota archaeon RBG_16_36_9]
MRNHPRENFEWTDEFVYKVLARGIFPGNRCDIQDTKDAVMEAINGKNIDSAMVSDAEHYGEKVIFPVRGRLVSFPFVRERGKIVIKSAFYSEKRDKDSYAKEIKITKGNIIEGNI